MSLLYFLIIDAFLHCRSDLIPIEVSTNLNAGIMADRCMCIVYVIFIYSYNCPCNSGRNQDPICFLKSCVDNCPVSCACTYVCLFAVHLHAICKFLLCAAFLNFWLQDLEEPKIACWKVFKVEPLKCWVSLAQKQKKRSYDDDVCVL